MRPNYVCIIVSFLVPCLYAGSEPFSNKQGGTITIDPGESARQYLCAQLAQWQGAYPLRQTQMANAVGSLPPSPPSDVRDMQETQPQSRLPRIDWQTMAQECRDFIARHPNNEHINGARKLELTAELIPLRGGGEITPELQSKIEIFVADTSIPETERYDISAAQKEIRLKLRKGMRMEEIMGGRLENARDLAAEFPSDPRSWTTMLRTARRISMQSAADVARQIVSSAAAPENARQDAQRLLDKYSLMQNAIEGIELATVAGRPALVYFWTYEESRFLDLLRYCKRYETLAFIGVNVDMDESTAREFAAQHSLPGELFYRGSENSGKAFYFSIRYPAALLADQSGAMQEVGSFSEVRERLRQMAEVPAASAGAGQTGEKGNLQ